MKFTEILKKNAALGASLTTDKFYVAVISNITVNLLKPVLELALREDGINAEVTIGDYDSVIQDSQRFVKSNAVLVFWETANLVDGFHTQAQTSELTDGLVSKVENEIIFVVKNLETVPLVLVNRFSSLIFETNPLKKGLIQSVSEKLNDRLEKSIGRNTILVDLDLIIASIGIQTAFDARNFLSSKSLYSFDFYKSYVRRVKPAFGGITGKIKKVLVLDCDNTLWGGILGEDGFDGIQMSDNTPKGKAYREAQKLFLNLKDTGVLIALCSKNNPEDVDKVITEHPDFLLKEKDIVAKRVNWADKASNLRQLSIDLNLGLDSFVFVDDSEFELGLIEMELPQVQRLQVPANISDYPTMIRELAGIFYASSGTKEDSQKTEMYKQEEERKIMAARFGSVDEYLQSLGLALTIIWDNNIPVERMAQLTQKTNQFNLTTRRYTETDIRNMLADGRHMMAAFSLADRYGDYGVTGAAIVQIADNGEVGKKAVMDTFLMSCRVIGRNVEYAFFEQIRKRLQEMNVPVVEAEYIATQKNQQVKDFYSTAGFATRGSTETTMQYLADTAQSLAPDRINSIKIISNG